MIAAAAVYTRSSIDLLHSLTSGVNEKVLHVPNTTHNFRPSKNNLTSILYTMQCITSFGNYLSPWFSTGHVSFGKVRKVNFLLWSLPEDTLSVFSINVLYHGLVITPTKLLIVLA